MQSHLRLLRAYLSDLWRKTPKLLSIALVLLLVSSITEGIGILMLIPIIDMMTDQNNAIPSWISTFTEKLSLSLLSVLMIFFLLLCIRAIVIYYRERVMLQIRLQFSDSLRKQLFESFLFASWSSRSQTANHQAIEQLTHGVNRVGMTTFFMLKLLTLLALFSAYAVVSVSVAPIALLLTCVFSLLLLLIFRKIFTLAFEFGSGLTNSNQKLYQQVMIFLEGMKSVKACAHEAYQLEAFEKSQQALRSNQQRYHNATTLRQLCIQSLSAMVICALVYVGIRFWQFGVTELAILVVMFSRMMPMFSEFQNNVQQLLHMLPAFADITKTISDNTQSSENRTYLPINFPLHSLSLDQVSFQYADVPIINNLSVQFPLNQVTLLTGPSGQGKTTLIDMLASLLEPSEGRVLLDDHPLLPEQRLAWRKQISYLTQDGFLFNGTIKDNVLFGEQANDDDIWHVLKLCQAHFVERLPQQLESVIGDSGNGLSGGEKQRIVLARALLRKRPLLILDEATNALDSHTELHIFELLQQLKCSTTIVLVSHSEQAHRFADNVITVK
ncbi:ABC transporter ATP-binding protein [Shewanella basaltis]|uniref:ABC transporter ATP-binding protein n=1 Tax=Shewanella basaltis TaxID=472183 RepID=UPI003AAA65BA